MKKLINLKNFSKNIICIMLIAAIASSFTACKKAKETESGEVAKSVSFTLVVVDGEGKETKEVIDTTEKTVGAALQKAGIIEGEEGPYGLYIKKVNGIAADYDKDKTYWSFYIDGEYAQSGVDLTDIEADKTYTLKLEK